MMCLEVSVQSSARGLDNPGSEWCVRDSPLPDTEEGRLDRSGMGARAPAEPEVSGLIGEHAQ